MNYLDQNGLKHLIEKIRAEIKAQTGQSPSAETKTPLNVSWSEVKQIVQSGKAEETFSLGDILVSGHSDFGEIQWEIIGFNREETENFAPYTMTLQSKNVLPNYCFDQREGFYYTQSGLAATSYTFFTQEGYPPESGEMQIHPKESISEPVTLVLVHGDAQNGQNDTVYAYRNNQSTPFTTIPTESVVWGDGLTLDISRQLDFGNGNNGWEQSSICQYLNKTAWTKTSDFDLPYKDVFRGFSTGFDPEFLAALGTITVGEHCVDGDQTYWYSQLFTLPSLGNVGAGESFDGDTRTYEKYQGETEEDRAKKRIKTRNGEFAPYLLRSPVKNTYNKVYYVASNGSVQETNACTEMGFSPICCVM